MGESSCAIHETMRAFALFLLAAAFSASFASQDSIAEGIEAQAPELIDEEPLLEYDLASAAEHLERLVPNDDNLKRHTKLISHHAGTLKLIQAQKALPGKAYSHNFARARNAIKAALAALTSDLRAGHSHDKRELNKAYNAAARRISDTERRNKGRVTTFKHKACPTKRAEEKASAKRRAAKAAVDGVKAQKICNVATNWKAMGIRGSTPKLGSAMYNKWAQARAQFVKKTAQHNAAIRAHNSARRTHDKAMTSFKVALGLECKNTYRSCRDTHKDYNRLKRDVAANVRTRKEVFIATLIVGCYADQLKNNSGARNCANRKRRTSTSRWNINPRRLAACTSHEGLANKLGPKNWQPTWGNCKQHRTIVARNKERSQKKERSTKERATKERNSKASERRNKSGVYRGGGQGINYGGYFYRTFAGASPNGRSNGCESSWYSIPKGCYVNPDHRVCQHFGRNYRWSTHVLCCAGISYGTVGYSPGNRWSGNYISYSGSCSRNGQLKGQCRAKVNGCSLRGLLRCKKRL